MPTTKRTKPQARRASKKKVARKPRRQAKAAKPKAPRRQKGVPRRQAAEAKASEAKAAGTIEKLPAREILRRAKPEKPKFLNSRSDAVKEKGFALMMTNWVEFAKIPLTYLTEAELKKLFDGEVAGRKRWNIVNRLHSAFNTKRIKRERAELRIRCGLDG